MAKYGAKYIRWAPFAETTPETDGNLPDYGTPVSIGELIKVTDAPAFNEAKLYGDNALQIYVNEYKECNVDVEVTDISNANAAAIFGATLTSDESPELQFAESDNAPYGGLGFYVCKISSDNTKTYQGIYYPKVKASLQGEEYTTKGDSITLASGKIKFIAAAAKNGQWKVESADLSSESAAKTWVDGKVKAKT